MLDLKVNRADPGEAVAAKSFWAETEFQHRDYGESTPYYARAMSELIGALRPESVFEFGCNAGRNLQLLRELPQPPRVLGVDINESSIEHGRESYPGLAIELGDEQWLSRQPPRAWSVSFTISVLDHIPAIEETLAELVRITDRVLILLEPNGDATGRVDEYKSNAARNWRQATPYSYVHPYGELLAGMGLRERINIALPTGRVRLGPLYRLRVLERDDVAPMPADFWPAQLDRMLAGAVLELVRTQQLAMAAERELEELRSSLPPRNEGQASLLHRARSQAGRLAGRFLGRLRR